MTLTSKLAERDGFEPRRPASGSLRDLRITRGAKPGGHGVTICLWYVPDEAVNGAPESVVARIKEAATC